jgi:hypothetical protein
LQKIRGQNGYQTAWVGNGIQTRPGWFWSSLSGALFSADFINMNNVQPGHGLCGDLISDFSLNWLKS